MFIILSVISACKNSTGITIADSWKFPNTVESRYIYATIGNGSTNLYG
jgi:hypothetical protein